MTTRSPQILPALLIVLTTLFTLTPSCREGAEQNDVQSDYQLVTIDEEELLIGLGNRKVFEVPLCKTWFDSTYQAYTLDTVLLDHIKSEGPDLRADLYVGTWCSDSRREVPALYKILDYLEVPDKHIRLVFVDRSKAEPAEYLGTHKIEFVPTIEIYEDNQLKGKIIEFPNETLEKDIYHMLGYG